jgi:tellurite resistance protein
MRVIVDAAIERMCAAFEKGGYNPTPVIDLGVLVANADGTVDDHERAVLSDIFQTLLDTKVTSEVVDHLVTASIEVIRAAGAGPRIRLVGAILKDCDASIDGLTVALAVAFASEGLSEKEREIVDDLAEAAGVEKDKLEELVEMVSRHAEDGPTSVRKSLVSVSPE